MAERRVGKRDRLPLVLNISLIKNPLREQNPPHFWIITSPFSGSSESLLCSISSNFKVGPYLRRVYKVWGWKDLAGPELTYILVNLGISIRFASKG